MHGEWTVTPSPLEKGCSDSDTVLAVSQQMARDRLERLREKKKIMAWVPATHVLSCISSWDIFLIGDIVGKSSSPGKSELFASHFLFGGGGCLPFSSNLTLPAVRTE